MSDYEAQVVDQVLGDYLAAMEISAGSAFALKRLCRDMHRFVKGFGVWTIGDMDGVSTTTQRLSDAGQELMREWRFTRARWLSDKATYGVLRIAVETISRLEPGLPLLQQGWRHTHVRDHWCVCDTCFSRATAALPELGLSEEERELLVARATSSATDDHIEPTRKRA